MSDEYWRVWADQAARKPWDEFTEVVMPPLVAERDALKARVELLTAALDTAIEALGWASDYVAVPWPKAYQVEPLRTALAAGVTESEDVR